MTGRLRDAVDHLVAVDGTRAYCDAVRAKFPGLQVVCNLFEDYVPDRRFAAVVMGHILEHVDDPVGLLGHARARMLADGGRILISVPNANSLHRQAGVHMGLLERTTALNEADLRIGHRRVYTRDGLCADIYAAGLVPVHVTGVFLKPVSNGQIEQHWSADLIEAYYQLGFAYPDSAAELFVVAEAPKAGRA